MNRPLHLNTQVEEDRRYSFAETPLEMHASGHHPALASAQQVRADANPSPQPAIEQQMHPSPQPAIQQQAHPSPQPAIQQEMHPAQYAASEKVQQFQHQGFMPTYSNYPGPERHPAHDAPFADAPQQQSDIQMHQFQYKQPPNSPGPLPVKTHPGTEPYTSRRDTVTVTPDMNPLQSPKSPYLPPPVAAGTSQAPAVDDLSSYHQPGQVLHPNQEVIGGTWSHGLCECSNIGTCCLGITCPCVLYGKTQHRLSAKSRKEDPTNMLGYQWCNGSCTAMALLCGCQWLLATIQHSRTRNAYDIHGNIASDCLHATCCTCCTLIQDENEIQKREEQRSRAARESRATLTSPYTAPGPMAYTHPSP